jgi:pyrroloquinoline quinone biosynthesis protein E
MKTSDYLTPKPNVFYYKAYFIYGLMLHPQRLLNYWRYKKNAYTATISHLPLVMDIEPTQRCNYRCRMCMTHKTNRPDLELQEFKNIIDEQYGLMEIKIQGVGEPFLNKDFIAMIKYAKKRHLWVRTTTNGSLLGRDQNYKKLVDSGINDVNISIDGATKEAYEAIRRGGIFERIIDNCTRINEYNNRVRKTTIRAWVVLQALNSQEIYKFPEFFSELGFKEMAYSFAMHNYGQNGQNSEVVEVGIHDLDMKRLGKLATRHKIKINFWFYPSYSTEHFCKIPFERIYLTTDKKILPCCYIANQEVVTFGQYKDFKNVWYQEYAHIRRKMKNKETVPGFCRRCYGG